MSAFVGARKKSARGRRQSGAQPTVADAGAIAQMEAIDAASGSRDGSDIVLGHDGVGSAGHCGDLAVAVRDRGARAPAAARAAMPRPSSAPALSRVEQGDSAALLLALATLAPLPGASSSTTATLVPQFSPYLRSAPAEETPSGLCSPQRVVQSGASMLSSSPVGRRAVARPRVANGVASLALDFPPAALRSPCEPASVANVHGKRAMHRTT
jgi:hypothetical protein